MSEIFSLKDFRIEHGSSSQKIGTDALLLGALAHSAGPEILDAGCGCGIIGFMMAQRFPNACVHLIDSDEQSILEAQKNADNVHFSNRLKVYHSRFQDFVHEKPIHTVVCNPPYFQNNLRSLDPRKSAARHNIDFNIREFFAKMRDIGSEELIVNIVIPYELKAFCIECAFYESLHPYFCTDIRYEDSRPFVRAVVSFARDVQPCINKRLSLFTHQKHTDEYLELMRPFLLHI